MAAYRLRSFSRDELREEIDRGARCVTFNYCFSLIHTLHGESDVCVVNGWWDAFRTGFGYTLGTMLLGWWGLYGVFLTPVYLFFNLKGGNDLTDQVLATLESDVLSERLVGPEFQQLDVDDTENPSSPSEFLKNLEREHRT